jgi:DNA-binding IclR family transcriptional regulator
MKTVKRAIDVLLCFSHEEHELSIGDISRKLGMHKSIASRMVAALCAKRMLQQDPKTRRVSIGVGAFSLGALFIKRVPLEQHAAQHISTLVERIQHSCHIAVLDGHRLLTITGAETRKALRVILRTGEHRFLHATAGGKLLLALTPGLLEEVAESTGFPAITNRTITSISRLRKEIAGIRDNGIAWNF